MEQKIYLVPAINKLLKELMVCIKDLEIQIYQQLNLDGKLILKDLERLFVKCIQDIVYHY